MILRPARADERAALEALQRRASLANPGDRALIHARPELVVLPAAQIADGHVFVAERDGVVVGFAVLLPRDDGDQELDGLFVEPDSWRSGAGRALVGHCASVGLARGARAVHVLGNPHAEGFYRACGFEDQGTVALEFGTALDLWLRLDGPSF